jgi:hypothetical protein
MEQRSTKEEFTPLLNGMKMSTKPMPTLFGLFFSVTHFFDDINLPPEQKRVLLQFANKIFSIPSMLLSSISKDIHKAIHDIMALPLSLIKQTTLIGNSLYGTYKKLNELFNKLTNMGLDTSKIKKMTIDILAGLLTKVIQTSINEFDAFIDRISKKALNTCAEGVKVWPGVGNLFALGTGGFILGDTVNDMLKTVATYMGVIKTSIDESVSKVTSSFDGLESQVSKNLSGGYRKKQTKRKSKSKVKRKSKRKSK